MVRNPVAVACLPGRLHANTEQLHIERDSGDFCLFLVKKEDEKGQ